MSDIIYMDAGVASKLSGPKNITFSKTEKPTIQDEEIMVEVLATGLNGFDLAQVKGKLFDAYPLYTPTKLGQSFAGKVKITHSLKFKKGDLVMGLLNPIQPGSMAEVLCVSDQQAIKLPPGVNMFKAVTSLLPLYYTQKLEHYFKGNLKNKKVGVVGTKDLLTSFVQQLLIEKSATPHLYCAAENEQESNHLNLAPAPVIDKSPDKFDVLIDCFSFLPKEKLKEKMTRNGELICFDRPPSKGLSKISALFSKQKETVIPLNAKDVNLANISDLIVGNKHPFEIGHKYSLSEIKNAFLHLDSQPLKGPIVIEVIQKIKV